MNPVGKALWYIESHFAQDVTLEEIASIAGISRFHMSRAFGAVMGCSVIRYVRARRLTEAARALANGAPDILEVALEAGYGSHEAFTRAFREQFGITPEAVRAQRSLQNLNLVEPSKMDASLKLDIKPPRLEHRGTLLIAGLGERITSESGASIPGLWQRFGPYIGNVPAQLSPIAYGVVLNTDEAGNMDYICGVEVADFSAVPKEFARVRVPERRYAVFEHREHISTIRSTWAQIWNEWLPKSAHTVADAPFFEQYGTQFDPRTGNGGLELWVPIEA